MKIAVLADIHGNLPALEAVLEDLSQFNPAALIVAGDLAGGPHSDETVALLRSQNGHMIRGNGDVYLLRLREGSAPEAWTRSKAFASMRWQYRHTSPDTLDFLEALPEQRVVKFDGLPAIHIVHGSPRRLNESIFPDRQPEVLEQALADTAEPVLVCGHTHLPWQVARNGRLVFNPGAVCGPLDGNVGAQYALLEWDGAGWRVGHRLVAYDMALFRRAYRDSGLLEAGGAFSQAILYTIETGRNIIDPLLDHANQLAAAAGYTDLGYVPDEIWDQAAATFPWPQLGYYAWQ